MNSPPMLGIQYFHAAQLVTDILKEPQLEPREVAYAPSQPGKENAQQLVPLLRAAACATLKQRGLLFLTIC